MKYYIIEFLNDQGENRKWRVPANLTLVKGIHQVFITCPSATLLQIQDVTEGKRGLKIIYL